MGLLKDLLGKQVQGGVDKAAIKEEEDIPDLVENFEEVSKKVE